jgi:AcrR family transcriptional regulator
LASIETIATIASTPAAPSRAQRADAQRNAERLLAAAREVFAEQGPDAALEEIARRAGLGIGTLYRHYPNRHALVEAVFRDRVEAAKARADALMTSATPGEALTEWLRDQLQQGAECRGLGAAAMIMMLDDDSGGQTPCEEMRAAGERLLARAQEAGAFRPDADIDDLVRLVNAIELATHDAPDGAAQADRLFALMMDGVRLATGTSR